MIALQWLHEVYDVGNAAVEQSIKLVASHGGITITGKKASEQMAGRNPVTAGEGRERGG
jgi:hypothetical protein